MMVADAGWPLPWLEAPWRSAMAQRGHALLLHGPTGVGQFELALLLAQSWLCESPRPDGHTQGPARPCGHCEGCRLLRAGAHPDLRLLVPLGMRESLGLVHEAEEGAPAGDGASEAAPAAKGKAAGRDIRIADVRSAIDWTHRSASRGGVKVLVIHPAQHLNAFSANALLKTLEEPPGPVRLIISCDDPQALLPTLRSRCQRVALRSPATDQALAWLTGQGVQGAEILLTAAGGRPQEALALAAEGLDARTWPELPSSVRHGRSEALIRLGVPRAVQTLQKICTDAMARTLGAVPQYFPAEAVPAGAQMPALSAWWRRLVRVARHDDHPWNASLLIESLVQEGRACWSHAQSGARNRSAAARSRPDA